MKKIVLLIAILASGLMFGGCSRSLDFQQTKPIIFISPTVTQNNQVTEKNNRSTKKQKSTSLGSLIKKGDNKMIKTLKDFTPIAGNEVVLHTNKGDITIKLFRDQAPLTTTNFLHLVKDKFYNGIIFHRVIADFMAQVGDPLTKDKNQKSRWGTGGPGYTIADEFNPQLKHDKKGIVSMANTGVPNTGGSQFFITFAATPWLDGKHAVFGQVINGLDVLDKINVGDEIDSAEILK